MRDPITQHEPEDNAEDIAFGMAFPALDEAVAPIRKPTIRTARRESGDAFDRAFAALEEALKERDASLSRTFAAPKTTPVTYLQPPVARAAPKFVAPDIMPASTTGLSTPAFVAPVFERVAMPAVAAPVADFSRVDAILAQIQLQQAAAELAAQLADHAPKLVQPESKPAADADLMPFGHATYRLLVM